MGKPTICIGENKGADQLRGNREADQRLCFCYSDSTIPLLLKSKISSFYSSFLCLYRPVCVRPVRKPHCWFSHEAAHITSIWFCKFPLESWILCTIHQLCIVPDSHCISGNVECVILYKTAFPTAKKGILDCQKICVGNGECSIYVLRCHFGNPKRLFMAI